MYIDVSAADLTLYIHLHMYIDASTVDLIYIYTRRGKYIDVLLACTSMTSVSP